MPLFDEIASKAIKLTEHTMDKSQELAKTAQNKLLIASYQSDLKDKYIELGKYYYAHLKSNVDMSEEQVQLVNEIEQLIQKIDELKQRL